MGRHSAEDPPEPIRDLPTDSGRPGPVAGPASAAADRTEGEVPADPGQADANGPVADSSGGPATWSPQHEPLQPAPPQPASTPQPAADSTGGPASWSPQPAPPQAEPPQAAQPQAQPPSEPYGVGSQQPQGAQHAQSPAQPTAPHQDAAPTGAQPPPAGAAPLPDQSYRPSADPAHGPSWPQPHPEDTVRRPRRRDSATALPDQPTRSGGRHAWSPTLIVATVVAVLAAAGISWAVVRANSDNNGTPAAVGTNSTAGTSVSGTTASDDIAGSNGVETAAPTGTEPDTTGELTGRAGDGTAGGLGGNDGTEASGASSAPQGAGGAAGSTETDVSTPESSAAGTAAGGTTAAGTAPAGPASSAAATAAPACPSTTPLTVAATARIAGVLKDVAARSCVALTVRPVENVLGAAQLTKGATAWIPDSRAFAFAAGAKVAAAAPSIALSPMVMAADPSTAAALVKAKANSWGALMAGRGKLGSTAVTIQPLDTGAAVTLAGLMISTGVAATGNKYLGIGAAAAAVTAVQPVPAAALATPVPAGQVRVVELRSVPKGSVAVGAVEGNPVLDYPWVMPSAPTGATKTAVDRMLAGLKGAPGSAARRQAGFTDPGAKTAGSSPKVALLPNSPAEYIPAQFLMSGDSVQHGNALALLDVSGSMNEPDASGKTPMQEIKASMPIMMSALLPETKVGAWEFGYQLDGAADTNELVPVAPLGQNKAAVLQAAADVQARPGGTALYSSVLAGFTYLRAHYDPASTNTLVVFTDGRNEDAPDALSLEQLAAQLKQLRDPSKPLLVVFFGFGNADIAAMQKVVDAADGGAVVKIDRPEQIAGAMIDAFGKLATFAR